MNEVLQAKKYLLSHSTTSAVVLPDPYRAKHVHCIDALKEKFNSILKHILLSSKEKKIQISLFTKINTHFYLSNRVNEFKLMYNEEKNTQEIL
jgi:hypothetical protein